MTENTCPQCDGRGFTFKKVGEAVRMQIACWRCGGTGKLADAMARTLSGEAVEYRETNWIDYINHLES